MESKVEHEASTAFGDALEFRNRLRAMFVDSPLPAEDLMFNLGLYVRSSLLVKFLVLNDLYLRFKSLPGALVEFGTWWGQNLVLLENLRAIHEPFNKQRTIIGFDTFSGYPTNADISPEAKKMYGGYNTGTEYEDYLSELLAVHEGNNAFGHERGNHKLVRGEVEQTAPLFFSDHPETLVAFAFFDMGPYQSTIVALRSIMPRLLPGSVLLFDELTWSGAPGEAIAYREAFANVDHDIEKCELYPSKAIVTVR